MSSSGGTFSFDTPQAVMHVLASVRNSDIAPAQKNALRDLILSYTNGGKDPSLKIQIEQQLNSLGVTPSFAPATAGNTPAAEPLDFGSARNVPAFTAPAPTAQPAVPQPVAQPTPTATTAAPAPVQVPPVQPVPAVPPAQQPASVPAATQPTPQPAPAATPASQPAPAPVPQPATAPQPVVPNMATDNTAALARIREIKSIVNEKIGNPVNLVDIDNTVGREYMASLLDAMKKLSAGVNSASAMQRLEASFKEVERVLEQPRPESIPTPTPAAEPVSVTPVAPAPQPAPVEIPKVESVAIPEPTPATTPSPARPQPVVEKEVAPQPTPKPEPKPVIPAVEDSKPEPKVAPVSAQSPKPELVKEKPTATSSGNDGLRIDDDRWSVAAAAIKPAPVKPLSEAVEPLKSVEDVPTQDSISNAAGDPLQDKEVDDGLEQLLSDWMLFKKSGLFGTGPKGREHPLYKKIKDLQIPLLLAGRFEGATQEIKQSITDYMNGWRYEQGIVYEQGETFDHYLRRVIRHILDLQK